MENIQGEETIPLLNHETKMKWSWYKCTLCCTITCLILCSFIFIPFSIISYYGFLLVFSPFPSHCRYYTPSNFTNIHPCMDNSFDFTPYFVPKDKWEEVQFYSRDNFWKSKGGGLISAYYYKNSPEQPTVIQVHGYRGCKQNGLSLLKSSLLWRAGFNVLSIDLRNHGHSQKYEFQSPVVTFGSEEHKDILGAFDWIQNRSTKAVGVMGVSMGGASALVSGWKEPKIKAIFGDCAVCKVKETLSEVARSRTPGNLNIGNAIINFVCVGSIKSIYGCPKFKNDPFDAVQNLKQAIHLDHHVDDSLVFRFNTDDCSKILQKRLGDKATYYFETKKSPNPKCDHHTFNSIFNITSYNDRLISFFKKNLN